VSLKELQLPSIASLRAIAALKSPHLALVRPARIGLGFESAGANQKTLAEIEEALGGPGRLSLPYSLRLLLDLLTGLGVLHRTLSFVHGEVQPEHVVLGEDGVGRLIPVVRAHWVRGEERAPERLYYLAPEKLLGDNVDARSDVFSVGVMLWEALTGQRLLEATKVDDIIARLMGGGIPRAQAPEAEAWTAPLSEIATRAIAVDPARRFASVSEMKDALQGACSRYVASAPGMAELFVNPQQHARSFVRHSVPPESQRVTMPPETKPVELPTSAPPASPPDPDMLDAAAERLARSSFASIDIEDETTTHPQAAPVPVPVVSRGKHVQTLLGVPPPFIERDSSPDSITEPFARIPVSTPVIITPLPVPMPARAAAVVRPASNAPAPASAPARSASTRAPAESRRAASLSPLVAAGPEPHTPLTAEPSFELTRPRKGRGALWLLLGACVAIGVFAARPWLARQVAAATGALPDNAAANLDAPPNAPVTPPTTSAAANTALEPSNAPRAVGIASTPAAPSAAAHAAHGRGGEEHVVIHDSVEPVVTPPAAPTPVERKPEPVAAPPAAPAPPTPPPAAPKPKPVPVSDADRYGI
jgi:serine/threonine protein kinase